MVRRASAPLLWTNLPVQEQAAVAAPPIKCNIAPAKALSTES